MLVLYLALAAGGAAGVAGRSSPGAAARGARRDPVRRATAVYALRTRGSGHGVLSCVRGGDAGVVALVTQVPAGRAPGASGSRTRGTMTTSPTFFPGYAVPADSYRAAPPRRTSRTRLVLTWLAAIAVVAGALVGVSAMIEKPPVRYMCPPGLRQATDGHAGGDQSPLHGGGRRLLGVASRRESGVPDHHETQRGDGRFPGRRRRHHAVLQ